MRGHYHVFLDTSDEAAQPLRMAWETVVDLQLSEAISVGTHVLRVSVRDEFHQILEVVDSVEFEVIAEDRE